MKFWMKESIDYSSDLWNPHEDIQRVGTSEYISNSTATRTPGQQISVSSTA